MKKKIERIILFGDSFVEGQGTYDPELLTVANPCGEPFNEQEHTKLRPWRKKNSWEKYLKKHFPDIQVLNYATQGSDNYSQYGMLNDILKKVKPTDVILFGFTSKYRDTPFTSQMGFQQVGEGGTTLLSRWNPLISTPIAHERISVEDKFGVDGPEHKFDSDIEKEFTYNFLKKWLVYTFDEMIHERIAQTNYMFYEEYCKTMGINIHFFDLFEPYVTPKFNDKLEIDTNIYLTYGDEDLHTYIDRYERENGTYRDNVSYWECSGAHPSFSNNIYHPNQHGYELWIDYMYDRWLSKWYE